MADTRDISMHFWATQEEYDLIQKNMALSGSTNLSAFLRKMAIDGMVIRLDMPEIREMLHLLRRANANINQIARQLTAWSSGWICRRFGRCCICSGVQTPTSIRLPDICMIPGASTIQIWRKYWGFRKKPLPA